MNCKPENYETFIIFKAQQWLEIETRAIDKRQRAWGRRNRLQLIRRHPEIFGDPGCAGESV
jgi:hypothetical protein